MTRAIIVVNMGDDMYTTEGGGWVEKIITWHFTSLRISKQLLASGNGGPLASTIATTSNTNPTSTKTPLVLERSQGVKGLKR